MDKVKDIFIKKLLPKNAEELSCLLQSARPEYSRYFVPFTFERTTIESMLKSANQDCYFAIIVGRKLAGFYMLRGFDQGYKVPSYGVWISPKYSGIGLASLTLQHAFCYCRINGIKKMMLKVHPENVIARKIYERNGFIQTGVDKRNNNLIFHRNI